MGPLKNTNFYILPMFRILDQLSYLLNLFRLLIFNLSYFPKIRDF
ncbi:MAG: hypothetical protein RLZZ197_652 [Bacteroidota bacterium]|jgi:hypothetical protein